MMNYLQQYLPPRPYTREDMGLALLPVLIAVIMLIVEYFGLQRFFIREYGVMLTQQGYDRNDISFFAQVYFSAFTFLTFIIIPLSYHRIFPTKTSNSLGLSIRHCRPHIPIYVILLAVMLPILWLMAAQPSFNNFYPMYKPASLSMWVCYELIYMIQFLGVEFFFRGFSLFRLEQRFGYHAITIMVVPYALLHIHKPFPEALASIVAGLVLGMLALKSRSIWPGVFVHCGVAFSMDLFALIRSGRLASLLS